MSEIDNKTEDNGSNTKAKILGNCQATLLVFTEQQMDLAKKGSSFDVGNMIKIYKHASDLDLLEQGKNTANIGLNSGSGGFNVTFIETVAGTATVDDDDGDHDDDDVSHHHTAVTVGTEEFADTEKGNE